MSDDVKRYTVNRNLFDVHEEKTGAQVDIVRPLETVFVLAEVYARDIKALLGMLQQWADGYDHTTPIDESLHPLYVETRDALKEARDRE